MNQQNKWTKAKEGWVSKKSNKWAKPNEWVRPLFGWNKENTIRTKSFWEVYNIFKRGEVLKYIWQNVMWTSIDEFNWLGAVLKLFFDLMRTFVAPRLSRSSLLVPNCKVGNEWPMRRAISHGSKEWEERPNWWREWRGGCQNAESPFILATLVLPALSNPVILALPSHGCPQLPSAALSCSATHRCRRATEAAL